MQRTGPLGTPNVKQRKGHSQGDVEDENEAVLNKLRMRVCSHSTLFDPIDNSPPDSSAHGIFQARVLEWVAIPFSRGSSRPHDQTHVSGFSCVGRRTRFHCATWETECVSKVKTWGKLYVSSQVSCPIYVTFSLPPMLFGVSFLVNCSS